MPSYFSQFTSKDGIWGRRSDGAPKFVSEHKITPSQEPNMESKAEQLAGTLVEGVKLFEKKVEEATAYFNQQLKEGHETVDAVVDHGKKLGSGIARLKAALGTLSNGGPPLDS